MNDVLPSAQGAPVLTVCFRGNRIRVGIISIDNEVIQAQNYPCDRTSPMLFVDSMCSAIQNFVHRLEGRYAFEAIGVSTGGWVDKEYGVWRYTRKIQGFKEPVPLAALLHRRLGLTALIDNDIHLSTLAELRCGVGCSFSNMLYYHMGSGIAVGVTDEKRLIRGAANYSGELGHGYYDPDDRGEYEMLEDFASGRGMLMVANSLLPSHADSSLASIANERNIVLSDILTGYHQGDALCDSVVTRALRGIGFSLVNLLSVTNSEALVFGGGIMTDGSMLQWLIDFINDYLSPPTRQTLNYVGTSRIHADDSGMIGAALMIREELNREDPPLPDKGSIMAN